MFSKVVSSADASKKIRVKRLAPLTLKPMYERATNQDVCTGYLIGSIGLQGHNKIVCVTAFHITSLSFSFPLLIKPFPPVDEFCRISSGQLLKTL